MTPPHTRAHLQQRAGDALTQDGPGALVTFRLPFDPTAPDALPVTPTLLAPRLGRDVETGDLVYGLPATTLL